MALINCPHCGKQVSDTVKICIHCGKNLVAPDENVKEMSRQEEKQFYKMSAEEQKALRDEFYSGKPEYAENDSAMLKQSIKITISYIIFSVCFFAFFIALSGGRLYHALSGKDVHVAFLTITLMLLAAGVIGFIVNRVFWFGFKKYRRNQLIIEKKFQRWLKEQKNTVYTVSFTPKQQKDKAFFDSVNVEKVRLEK